MTTRRLYKVPEVAEMLGVSEKLIWKKLACRELASVRLSRCVRIPADAVDAWIEAGTTPAISDSAPLRSYRRGAAGRRPLGPVPIDDVRDGTG
jgi:excisionase family DNA binding protein